MANKVLQTEFRAKDGGIISLMKETGASADTLKKKMLELQQVGKKGGAGGGSGDSDSDGGGVVKQLKAGLGAKSDIGQLGKALKGGGAILGLTLIAGELGKAAENAKQLKEQFNAGEISAGGMVEGIAKGLPVIGSFFSAGRQIKELLASFDGLANSGFGKLIGLDDLNYAQKINKELAATKAVDEYIVTVLDKQKVLLKQIAEEHTHIIQAQGKLGKEGDELKSYDLKIQQENRLSDVQKKRQDALDEADKRRNDAMGKIRDNKDISPALAFKAEQDIQKKARAEKAKINSEFNSAEHDANNLNYLESWQAEIDHAKQIATLKSDTAKELLDSQADAYAKNLKLTGDSLGAELILIQKNAKDKKDAILKSLAEQSKGASQADIELFNKLAGQKIAAVDADAAGDARLARKVQQESAIQTLQQGQLAVLRQQAESGDEDAAAELKRLEAAKANNDEQKKLLDLLKQQLTPQERALALAELQALKTADHAGVVKQLADQAEDTLKAQAEHGSSIQEQREAQKQLEVLKLKKEYNAEAAKAAAIINNPNATAADKAAAAANLKAYAATAGSKYDKDLGKGENNPLKTTANLEERGLLITGVAAAARAKADPAQQQLKLSEQGVKLTQDLVKQAQKTTELLSKQTPVQLIHGVSD